MAKGKFTIGKYDLVVRRSRTGRGLFTLDPIESRRCIVEYTGRILSEAEEYTSKSKYLFAVNKTKTIDGREKTNIARYINHSCRPNCATAWTLRFFGAPLRTGRGQQPSGTT